MKKKKRRKRGKKNNKASQFKYIFFRIFKLERKRNKFFNGIIFYLEKLFYHHLAFFFKIERERTDE